MKFQSIAEALVLLNRDFRPCAERLKQSGLGGITGLDVERLCKATRTDFSGRRDIGDCVGYGRRCQSLKPSLRLRAIGLNCQNNGRTIRQVRALPAQAEVATLFRPQTPRRSIDYRRDGRAMPGDRETSAFQWR